jgi:hypothetical protein
MFTLSLSILQIVSKFDGKFYKAAALYIRRKNLQFPNNNILYLPLSPSNEHNCLKSF